MITQLAEGRDRAILNAITESVALIAASVAKVQNGTATASDEIATRDAADAIVYFAKEMKARYTPDEE